MGRKFFFSFMLLLVCSLFLFGCKSSLKSEKYLDQGNNTEDTEDTDNTAPNRKIIYEVNADIITHNLKDTVAKIKSELTEEDWTDLEDISDNYAKLIIRVKTARLDDFLEAISEDHEISNFKKKATDISLKYQDKSNLLLTYQKEQERLLELYEDASLSDMIYINKRLSELEVEILKLKGELNQFDSLVEYSTIHLNISSIEKESKLPFGKRINNAFKNGFDALLIFLDFLAIVFVTLLPWFIVFIPVGLVFYLLYKNYKKKYKKNNQVTHENNQKERQ